MTLAISALLANCRNSLYINFRISICNTVDTTDVNSNFPHLPRQPVAYVRLLSLNPIFTTLLRHNQHHESTEGKYTATEYVWECRRHLQSIWLCKTDSASVQQWNVNVENLCSNVTERKVTDDFFLATVQLCCSSCHPCSPYQLQAHTEQAMQCRTNLAPTSWSDIYVTILNSLIY